MRNPSRRNRNIGTAKQGHGQNNRLVIPSPGVELKSFHERLGRYTKHEKIIHGHSFLFVVEETRKNAFHACSVDDISHIIENIPSADYGELRFIVLRQPKRKEETLSPVWGRLIYSYEFEGEYYPAIIIEAQNHSKKFKWGKHLSPESQKELERLRQDGHAIIFDGRQHQFEFIPEYVRNTQLYRTLPHEFGHYVHYLETVEKPTGENEDTAEWDKRYDEYFGLPTPEKEKYAHAYADKLSQVLTQKNIIPFQSL